MSGKSINSAQLLQRSVRLAECLQAAGVGVGDVIGLSSENRPEFAVPVFASFLLGATLAPLNITYTERKDNILGRL